MYNVSDIINKACGKLDLKRVFFDEKKIPTSIDNVVIFPFFGDMRSSFILSSILLRRIKEESKSSKYFILLSWPGYHGLYPYADEYWTIKDESVIDKLRFQINGFQNFSSYYTLLLRSLNEYFYEILTYKDLFEFYDQGITKLFFEKFKHIKVSLPTINSSASLGIEFARKLSSKELKVFIYPCKHANSWRMGKVEKIDVSKDFWLFFLEGLVRAGYNPIIYRDIFCHDISVESLEISNECINIWDNDLSKVLSAIRASGFVLDLFSQISRLAICARTPFLCFDERSRYNNLKEFEIDDTCGKDLIKEYIFSFATILSLDDKNNWKNNIVDTTVSKLNKIFPLINRDSYPSSAETNRIVPYDFVRKSKNKKFGPKFIKVKREEI